MNKLFSFLWLAGFLVTASAQASTASLDEEMPPFPSDPGAPADVVAPAAMAETFGIYVANQRCGNTVNGPCVQKPLLRQTTQLRLNLVSNPSDQASNQYSGVWEKSFSTDAGPVTVRVSVLGSAFKFRPNELSKTEFKVQMISSNDGLILAEAVSTQSASGYVNFSLTTGSLLVRISPPFPTPAVSGGN